ncbi:MAG: ATP-binding protein [Acidobacteria bacterium]|nr:ATP-binding protein [Acidobacteriota bacterium]
MTIARQFNILVSSVSLLVLAVAAALAYQFANVSAQGTSLLENLQRTSTLSQQLTRGNAEHLVQMQRQLVQREPGFAENLKELNYRLGERYTEYLKLDIGVQERLTVERAKALQFDSNLLSMQAASELAAGKSAEVAVSVQRLYRLHDEIRTEFDQLSALQLAKLRDVVVHLERLGNRGLAAFFTLIGLTVVGAVVSTVVLRRRILGPVSELLAASDRMRRGDLTARVQVRVADEFGQLTEGFNFMAESLAESYAGLERKVEDRAKQLHDVQAKLSRAEKMSAVGLLVSGVAHELNNPLATIRGFAELAKMELTPGGDHAKAIGLLDEADAQVERCRKIVANLLQFARQQEPRLEAVGVNEMVDQVLSLREYELGTRNITLVREFDPSNPVMSADRSKMQQVMLNLLNNAHDAIRGEDRAGTIWVRTRRIGTSVAIEFADDGPGFRDPVKAFDPFYTTKDVGQGTGLGLSVCYGIVEEHGGEILAGNWEKGARVAITLPVGDPDSVAKNAQPAPPSPEPASREPGTTSERRALVVDDEEMLVRLQVSYLAKLGIQATGVATGAEGIRHLEANDVDLIISDVRMPGPVDGIQLYEWVRLNRPRLARRFVFASGDLVGMNQGDFFQRTLVLRVEKPFRFADYADVVRQVLASERT